MPRFVSKIVEIEAFQLSSINARELSVWCGGQLVESHDPIREGVRFVGINIPTLEGVMRATEGDYIIKGTHGEFYPCKANVFETKYASAE